MTRQKQYEANDEIGADELLSPRDLFIVLSEALGGPCLECWWHAKSTADQLLINIHERTDKRRPIFLLLDRGENRFAAVVNKKMLKSDTAHFNGEENWLLLFGVVC